MQEKSKVFIGNLTEKTTKDGRKFFAGKMGFNGLLVFQSKNDPTKWNVYITDQESKEEREKRKFNQGGGYNNQGDGIPF